MIINGINYTFGHQTFSCMVKLMKKNADGYFMISEADKKVYCERCDAYVKKSAKCHNKLWIMNTGIQRQRQRKEDEAKTAEQKKQFELMKIEELFKLNTVNQYNLDDLFKPKEPEEPKTIEEVRARANELRRRKSIVRIMNKRNMMRQISLVNGRFIKYVKRNTLTLDEAIRLKEQINKFNTVKIIIKPEWYIQRKEDIDRVVRKLGEAHYEVEEWTFKEVSRKEVIDRQEYDIVALELSKEKTAKEGNKIFPNFPGPEKMKGIKE